MPCSLALLGARARHRPRARARRFPDAACGAWRRSMPLSSRVTSTPISRPPRECASRASIACSTASSSAGTHAVVLLRPRGSNAPNRAAPGARRRRPRPHRGTSPDAQSPCVTIGVAPRCRSATAMPTAVCGSMTMPALSLEPRDGAAVSASLAAARRESPPRASAAHFAASVYAPDWPSPAISRRTAAASRPSDLEQQALEIRRDLDVHRGRGRRGDAAHLVAAGQKRAVQDVVHVGRDDEPLDRQPHSAWRRSPRRCCRNSRSAR